MAIVNSVVYDTLISIIRADKRGLSLSIDEYNLISRVVNERAYSKYYDEFEESTTSASTMGGFKRFNESIALIGGVGTLPADYYELIGKPHYIDTSGVTRYFDLVSTLELAERSTDYLTQPTTTHPLCVIGGADTNGDLQISVYPASLGSIHIDYLSIPAIPFLDYYVNDTTLVTTYLTDGQTAITIPLGFTYRTGVGGVVLIANSATQDWDWNDSDMNLILALFCQHIGVALPDQMLTEIGIVNEEKG